MFAVAKEAKGDGEFNRMARRPKDIPHPWTFENLAAEYMTSLVPARQEALLYFLAASRDRNRGLVAAGKALESSDDIDTQLGATRALEAWWMGPAAGIGSGGGEVMVAARWWRSRRAELLADELRRSQERRPER